MSAPPVLLTPPRPGRAGVAGGLVLDERQQAAVQARGRLVRVIGGPGTGVSSVAVRCVVDRVASGERVLDEIVLIGATRRAAAALRDEVTAATGGTSTEPRARTMQSLGLGILRQQAAMLGLPPPRLLSGADQDVVLGELLAGHQLDEGGPVWPDSVVAAVATRGFRDELRDLLMRAVEHRVDPQQLADLGVEGERPEWVAAAEVAQEYDEVTALASPSAFDPAWVLTATADLLEADGEVAERVAASIRTVVVDDAQELTAPAARVLAVLADLGTDLVLLGDPDAAVQTFRGAQPEHLVRPWPGLTGPTVELATGYRVPRAVAEADARVVSRIGVLGGGGQRSATGPEGGQVEVSVYRSAAQEAAAVAHHLRRAHLLDGVPWSELAVVVRGAGRQSTLRRVLSARGVPVAAPVSEVPVHEEAAARPLLLLLRMALATAREDAAPVSVEDLLDVLGGPLVGADAVAVRRLRRALRAEELAAGGARTSDELLQDGVLEPEQMALLGPDVAPLVRAGVMLRAGREVLGAGADQATSAETVLWAMWSAAGVAERWRELALAGGGAGRRADRWLDAVVALLDAAAGYEEALPRAGAEAFLEAVTAREVAADSLSARGVEDDAVALVTPQSAAGRQWRRVVVAGVQEGVWPDLRLRGSLLGSEQLVDVVQGREGEQRSAREQVRGDETRLLHVALTRARESVLVTAVRSEDEQPSAYLDLIDPRPIGAPPRATSEAPSPLDLSGVVARLRQDLVPAAEGLDGPRDDVVVAAAQRLAALDAAGVAGCDPQSWWTLREVSDDRPLRAPEELVPVSPSRVELFNRCGLRWLLTTHGGEGIGQTSSQIGTLLHAIAEEHPDADAETVHAEIDRRWAQLGYPPGWVSEATRSRAHDMGDWLVRYWRSAAEGGWQVAGVEVPFRAQVGRATLAGRVDRVETDAEGRVRVVDYKTGSSVPTRADLATHAQLGTYQVAVAEGGFGDGTSGSAGALIVNLGRATTSGNTVMVQPPLERSEDPRWAHDLLAQTADGMSAATVAARPQDALCPTCPVRSSCPAQDEGGMLR